VTQHQNFSTPHYVFRCVDPCKSFLSASTTILSLQLPSQSIEVVVRQAFHQMTENHLIDSKIKYKTVTQTSESQNEQTVQMLKNAKSKIAAKVKILKLVIT